MTLAFHLFEPLPLDLADGRRPKEKRRPDKPTRWVYAVRRDKGLEFYNRLKAAGIEAFFIL